ncbi:hypothetical protein CXF97_17645 [Pseudomonas sp. Choline-02u-1]|nr:hypothetical protein CXF97_17645 [Pseudomonas sp. Choline-02u-1]
MWERACSRKRGVSQCMCKLTQRLREQAPSHTGYVGGRRLCGVPEVLWERACSRKRSISRNMRC